MLSTSSPQTHSPNHPLVTQTHTRSDEARCCALRTSDIRLALCAHAAQPLDDKHRRRWRGGLERRTLAQRQSAHTGVSLFCTLFAHHDGCIDRQMHRQATHGLTDTQAPTNRHAQAQACTHGHAHSHTDMHTHACSNVTSEEIDDQSFELLTRRLDFNCISDELRREIETILVRHSGLISGEADTKPAI
jgi:hypothetical protein